MVFIVFSVLFRRRINIWPGVFFALLGIEALAVTITPPPTAAARALVIALGVLLCVGEIFIVQYTGSQANRKREELFGRVVRMAELVQSIHAARENPRKQRILMLAYEILDFAGTLRREDPSTVWPGFTLDINESARLSTERMNKIIAFNSAASNGFENRFGPRIDAAIEDLTGDGIGVAEIIRSQHPGSNYVSMEWLARWIEAAAKEMPE